MAEDRCDRFAPTMRDASIPRRTQLRHGHRRSGAGDASPTQASPTDGCGHEDVDVSWDMMSFSSKTRNHARGGFSGGRDGRTRRRVSFCGLRGREVWQASIAHFPVPIAETSAVAGSVSVRGCHCIDTSNPSIAIGNGPMVSPVTSAQCSARPPGETAATAAKSMQKSTEQRGNAGCRHQDKSLLAPARSMILSASPFNCPRSDMNDMWQFQIGLQLERRRRTTGPWHRTGKTNSSRNRTSVARGTGWVPENSRSQDRSPPLSSMLPEAGRGLPR